MSSTLIVDDVKMNQYQTLDFGQIISRKSEF